MNLAIAIFLAALLVAMVIATGMLARDIHRWK